MNKFLSLVLLTIFISFNARATDLIVEEFGSSPTYSTIAAAVAAAVDGDRIVIKNRAGGIPWVENITVTKSLDFLPYVNDSFFIVQGTYTLAPTTAKVITIVGMVNTSGSITTTTNPTGARSIVRVLGSQINGGDITVDANNYDVTVSGNRVVGGTIYIRHGNIIGNEVSSTATGIYIGSETATTNDTIAIIGNKITTTTGTSTYGISWNSSSAVLDIRNNFVTAGTYGIYLSITKSGNAALNKIYNNSVVIVNNSTTTYAIWVATGSTAIAEIMNNIVDRNNNNSYTCYGVYSNPGSGAQHNCYFNVFDNVQYSTATLGTFTVNSNNTNTAVVLNANGTAAVGNDAGNPATVFYDLDLTRNDCGWAGGSFSQANFFPLFTGSTRTWLTAYPFNIRTGNTLSVKGTSFDR